MKTRHHTPPQDKDKQELQRQLDEALDALEAIRTGQVDAIVVQAGDNHELYTLQSADRAYRTFIENMSEGAVTLQQDSTIEYANAQFAYFMERPLTEVIGRPFTDFLTPVSHLPFHQMVDQCRQYGHCRVELDLSGLHGDVPALLSLTNLETAGEHRFPMIVTDLREQRRARLQLQEQNHALMTSNYDLQQFASVASHDLQEPLRKIATFTNLILARDAENLPDNTRRYLDKISVSATRMQQLIVDVLNFSRLSAGPGHFERVDLRRLVHDILDDFELLIEQKGAIIDIGDLPLIIVQPIQMAQALRNLLSNALKFSKPDVAPRVTVSATRVSALAFDSAEQVDGAYCLLRVSDNGIGFDDVHLEKIFGLFQRLHGREAYEGTGIGLAITKKIVEQHNGLIEASGHPGTGAEFRILLPVEQG